MKKFLSLILIATFFITHTTEVTAAAMSRNSTYTTLSTQYRYIYKQENGKTYRRLINATTGEPVSSWKKI